MNKSVKKYVTANVIINTLFVGVLYVVGNTQYGDFKQYHVNLAKASVAHVAESISGFVKEKRRLVNIFAQDNMATIKQLADNPYNDSLDAKFRQRLKRFFPNYFAYTLTDAKGVMFKDDFEGYVGEVCKTDIARYAHSEEQKASVHPNEHTYHFDIMSNITFGHKKIILFISFRADLLGQLLKASQSNAHRMYLVRKDRSYLIEVMDVGARNREFRTDYRLSDPEKNRILAQFNIPNTHWAAIDIYSLNLFDGYKTNLKHYYAILEGLLFFLSSIILWVMYKIEYKRLKAERHKDEILNMVAHDLRTPLTAIKGSVDIMLSGILKHNPDKAHELLVMAKTNTDRMIELINDLLDIKKMESGKIDLNFQHIELDKYLPNIVKMNESYASLFNVSYQLDIQTPHCVVNADELRLTQVINNLVSNAAKYGAENDKIVVCVKQIRNRIQICVIDHGPGIPEELRDHLFEKFTQAKQTKSTKVKSSGFGLFLVKKIVELHSGAIHVESKLNEETRFIIELPAVIVSKQKAA